LSGPLFYQVTIDCECIVEQDAAKPSIFWEIAVPCPRHERGDRFVDQLDLPLLKWADFNKAVRKSGSKGLVDVLWTPSGHETA
jgi:hypothetical protein